LPDRARRFAIANSRGWAAISPFHDNRIFAPCEIDRSPAGAETMVFPIAIASMILMLSRRCDQRRHHHGRAS
jgi:hypothetical protein